MPGRPPKPTRLRILEGNPGKRPLNKAEPQPSLGLTVQCPAWMSVEAKRIWRKLRPILERMGVFTEADAWALAMLCETLAEFRAAREVVRAEGATTLVVTQSGVSDQERPEVKIAQNAFVRARQMMQEDGLTPSSRSRLSVAEVAKTDPFESYDQKMA